MFFMSRRKDDVDEIADYLLDMAIFYGPLLFFLATYLRRRKISLEELFWLLGPHFFTLFRTD